jgi:murein peptide amidase A
MLLALIVAVATGACGAPGVEVDTVGRDAVQPTATTGRTQAPPSSPAITRPTNTTPPSTAAPATVASTTVPPSTVPPITVPPTPPPTTVPPTTVPPTTGPPLEAPTFDLSLDQLVLGNSVEGRPIIADRYGTPGGRRVLIIGVIHGDEDGGVPILDELRQRAGAGSAPEGVELWLVDSMNPDGQTAQDRQNANGVDLNRNFPHNWGTIGTLGDSQYAGTGPASEPETQAMVAFVSQLRPDLAIWYHQDANLIIPSTGRDGRIRARYAELSGLPMEDCCGGGIYTGVAATWARNELSDREGVAFIVELPGGDLPAEQVTTHADAVSTIAVEAATL